MAKGIVRLDNVKSVRCGHIYDLVHNAELENGMVGHVGSLVNGEREIRNLVVPTTASIPTSSAVLIAADEIIYDESTMAKSALGNFSIPANKPAKAYELSKDDIFSVSKDMITALATDPVVGNHVILANNSTKMAEIAKPAGTEMFVGEIEAIETLGTTTVTGMPGVIGNVTTMVVIKVKKNL